MIAELVEDVSYCVRREYGNGEPENTLPRTGYERRRLSGQEKFTTEEPTFAVYPQQRISRVPFLKDVAIYKPYRSSLRVSVYPELVICRRFGRR